MITDGKDVLMGSLGSGVNQKGEVGEKLSSGRSRNHKGEKILVSE